jgi:peptidoglycan/xylan/chitin deacetylase (PgdA/CDA1 family)
VSVPPILGYHKIDARFELGFTQLGPRTFRRQVEALARAGYRTLGTAELQEALGADGRPGGSADGKAVPTHPAPRTVVLTFDDAYAALAVHAFPVLADHGFRALVFVITDFAGLENTWDVQYGWRRFYHLSWDQLAEWQERGIEVHSHGASHARLTWLPDDQVAEELGRSREMIASRLGRASAAISYPFGAADARVRALAVAAGYTLGFGGPNAAGGGDPMWLEQRTVYAWDRSGVPLVLHEHGLGPLARGLARFTNRCAVGTAMIQRALGRRYPVAGAGNA